MEGISGLSGEDILLENGIAESKGSGCKGCVILTENDVVNIMIERDGKFENIKLNINDLPR
ncbi:hypothetical protein DCC39_18180 [Pueribacillus theae]|uniref:Uncharacterized protein n=1 Tax=Pueribacillus theae TaxID=2171751 RepID=A0A2U1JJW6_9BACI|nr:hypothetical protein [Pueribacillus theae]PWA05294.1 hypothetical protein DCC39_18180 [Pueribacillus theae]